MERVNEVEQLYKLIAVDMDGTLLRSDKRVDEDTIEDIKKARNEGIEVVYCTGRSLLEMEEYFELLPMMRYAVCYSGAIVYDVLNRSFIYRKDILKENIDKTVEIAKKYEAMLHFMSATESIVSIDDVTHMADFQSGIYQSLFEKIARKVEDMGEEAKKHPSIPKINIYFRSSEDRQKGYDELKDLPLTFAFVEESALEMTALGVTKALGLQHLIDFLKISMDQVVGIGDSGNDREMLEAVGLSIAMKNGTDEIKEICDCISDDCDHNGVGKAIQYVVSRINDKA